MDPYEALRTIQALARIALGSRDAATSVANDDEGLSAETIAEMQRRTLNGIVVVTEKALVRLPGDE